MALNIENISGGTLAVNDLGIELGIGEIRDIALAADPQVIALSGNGGDLETLITGSSIEVKDPIDGVTNLSTADALAAIRAHNETHWRVGAGARLGDISDVDVAGASSGDVLQLSGGGTWEDVAPSSLTVGSAAELIDADGDTRIQVEEGADDDTIRMDVGDTPAGYGAVTDIITLSAAAFTMSMGTADAATAGAPISITSGVGGDAASDGGDITITGGDGGATSGTGGNITLQTGDGDTEGVVRIPNQAGSNALILHFDTDGTGAPEIRREDSGGTLAFMSDATVPQIIGGSDAAGTTDFFIDADNDGVLHLNDLHTGVVRIGQGGLQIERSSGGAFQMGQLISASMTTSYNITWPPAQGGASTVLTNDGAGVLSWAASAGGNAFETIVTPTGGPVVADSSTDTLTLTQSAGIAISGTAGTDTINIGPADDLAAIEALATTGFPARTAANTWALRTLTQPAAGITISNSGGVAGNPTFALANDLLALEGLATTGIAARTGTDTWATRTITGTTNQITMTNGNGVSGNPTIAIATNPVLPGTASVTVPAGATGARPGSPVAGMLRFNSTNSLMEFYDGTQWVTFTANLVGSPLAYHFLVGGKPGGGTYLGTTTNHIGSDEAPYVIPYASTLVGIAYSNKNDNTSPVINVMRATFTGGTADASIASWTPANCRVAYRTNFSVAIAAGDKIAVHMAKGANTEPDRPVVSVYLRITAAAAVASQTEDYSGNFSF